MSNEQTDKPRGMNRAQRENIENRIAGATGTDWRVLTYDDAERSALLIELLDDSDRVPVLRGPSKVFAKALLRDSPADAERETLAVDPAVVEEWCVAKCCDKATADFVAHAPDDMLALLRAVDLTEREAAKAHEKLDAATARIDELTTQLAEATAQVEAMQSAAPALAAALDALTATGCDPRRQPRAVS